MTDRMRKFVVFMAQTGCGAQAARMAGYSSKFSNCAAYRLRNHPEVKQELERLARDLDARLAAVQDASLELALRRRARLERQLQGRATP